MKFEILGFNLFFRVFILFILFLSSCFSFGFSLDDLESSEKSSLHFIRDGMWNLAVDVYLYESVLFNPLKYFDLNYSDLEDVEVVSRKSSVELNITSDNIWSTPVGPYVNTDNLDFIPGQLFDITFNVFSGNYLKVSDIVAVVTFENFGTELTRVELTYTLFNSTNNIIFKTTEFLDVEVEESIFKEFKDDLPLLPGNYKFVLETVYGDNIRDSFESDFVVSSDSGFMLSGWILYLVGFLFFIFLMILFIFIYRKFFGDRDNDVISDFNNVSNSSINNSNVVSNNSSQINNSNLVGGSDGAEVSGDETDLKNDFETLGDSMNYEGDDFDDVEIDVHSNIGGINK